MPSRPRSGVVGRKSVQNILVQTSKLRMMVEVYCRVRSSPPSAINHPMQRMHASRLLGCTAVSADNTQQWHGVGRSNVAPCTKRRSHSPWLFFPCVSSGPLCFLTSCRIVFDMPCASDALPRTRRMTVFWTTETVAIRAINLRSQHHGKSRPFIHRLGHADRWQRRHQQTL